MLDPHKKLLSIVIDNSRQLKFLMADSNEDDENYVADYDEQATHMCDSIYTHVHQCNHCQRRLSFDPIEKALLKTHSVKNEILELIAFIFLGIMIILIVHARFRTK